MDISNIYFLKNESFEIVSQEWVKIGWLKMNKELMMNIWGYFMGVM